MSTGPPLEISEESPHRAMDTYSISTPFGTVTISEGGRRVTFDLYSDVRQSRHNVALFGYIQQLRKKGVTEFNTDHIKVVGRDRLLPLTRGKAKLDLVYRWRGKLYECELKTSREIGLEVTAQQLTELVKHCENLVLLVPRGCLEEAMTIATMLNLNHHLTIAPYDELEESEE